MPDDNLARAHITSNPPIGGTPQQCAFCQDSLLAGKAKEYRGELLCAACAKMALSAQRTKKPTSDVGARASEIDTYSMSSNRIALVGIGSVVLVVGSVIVSVLVYQGTRDTWERDNADVVLALAFDAQTLLDRGDRVAALAMYEELNGVVDGLYLADPRLRQAVKTARERKAEIERSPIASTRRSN